MSCPWAPMPPRARSHDRGLTGFEAECRFLRDARPLSNRSVQEENMLREGVGTVHGVRHPRGVSEDTAPPAPRSEARDLCRVDFGFGLFQLSRRLLGGLFCSHRMVLAPLLKIS
uniref:Fibroblast growth factor 2 n=1 Tax=Rousettus aegyptiacus TaxID=9407 RepID=A0A7J8BR79_ROUAE|nr:fibroblast growth factor 2 [Rousettus aegyptiacus]